VVTCPEVAEVVGQIGLHRGSEEEIRPENTIEIPDREAGPDVRFRLFRPGNGTMLGTSLRKGFFTTSERPVATAQHSVPRPHKLVRVIRVIRRRHRLDTHHISSLHLFQPIHQAWAYRQ